MKENRRKHLMQSEVEKMMAAAENGSELGQLSLSDMDVAADNL